MGIEIKNLERLAILRFSRFIFNAFPVRYKFVYVSFEFFVVMSFKKINHFMNNNVFKAPWIFLCKFNVYPNPFISDKTILKFNEKTRKLITLEGDTYIIDVYSLTEAVLFIHTNDLEITKANRNKFLIKNQNSGSIIKGEEA